MCVDSFRSFVLWSCVNSPLFHFFSYICFASVVPWFQYIDFANEIIIVSQLNANHIFETYKSMSLQMTAYAAGTKSVWPFVSFPHFEAQAAQAINFSGANFVAFNDLFQPWVIVGDDRNSTHDIVIDLIWCTIVVA